MPKTYPKTCKTCGANFIALRSTAKYCSLKCKRKGNNAQFRQQNTTSRTTVRKHQLREMGLCVCLDPLGGKTRALCPKCAIKRNAHARKVYQSNLERKRRKHSPRTRPYTVDELAKGRERKRKWYQNNKEHVRIANREWVKQNPDKTFGKSGRRRARKMGAEGSHTREEWIEILKQHNYRCAYCGTMENITKDHIIPLSKNGSDYASNIQPLCKSCNSRKNDKIAA
jgi:5-methylcytosine-specific restriction endonuclease McrA